MDFSEWKRPHTKKQLQSILGKISWYREFIPSLHTSVDSLYDKLSNKNNKITITDEEYDKIRSIYHFIKTNATNYHPDPNSTFYIHTDASDTGIGAVLTQQQGVIDHMSKKLTTSKKTIPLPKKSPTQYS